jgi:hypothetical protein
MKLGSDGGLWRTPFAVSNMGRGHRKKPKKALEVQVAIHVAGKASTKILHAEAKNVNEGLGHSLAPASSKYTS